MGVLLFVTLTAPSVPAEPPTFTVRNVAPAFVVENKMPAAGPKRVELNGLWYDRHPDGRLDFCHSCNAGKPPPPAHLVTPAEHDALIRAGAKLVAAPGVAAPRPSFRGPAFDPDHLCDACGRLVTVVSAFVGGGRHRHDCPCGNSWVH